MDFDVFIILYSLRTTLTIHHHQNELKSIDLVLIRIISFSLSAVLNYKCACDTYNRMPVICTQS